MGKPGRKHARLQEDGNSSPNSLPLLAIPEWEERGTLPSPEEVYTAAVSPSHRRRYAQFFTPPRVAKLMAEWAITPTTESVLEPAVGTGALIRAILARKRSVCITAFEKDPLILRAFLETHPDLSRVEPLLTDFLTYNLASTYDAALMNPPYLRHHDLSYSFDIFSHFERDLGINLSRLSNAYLLFTLKVSMALKPGGRASIIIPTEWMNANFGTAMKNFLVGRGFLRELVYFSGCSDIFDDALTTASVMFLERPAQ